MAVMTEGSVSKIIVGTYSVIHFVVDLACVTLMTIAAGRMTSNEMSAFMVILIYNNFAFAVQLPIGIIADKINKNTVYSAVGCLLVAIAYGFVDVGILAGGNCGDWECDVPCRGWD